MKIVNVIKKHILFGVSSIINPLNRELRAINKTETQENSSRIVFTNVYF